ncbi:MAG: hypothetical protein KatS3mg063_1787 [Tepidiforma sp.]|jgi:hypothetical protein|uniref:Uncharacterized protein n=1 Tax=Tepidiforma bonchosmolovskayae TaxID=2601677 RepID=A0ABX6BYU9_9CHLR|nr:MULTISPECIES: hypothetical protein [Tepidiforma]QFG02062.1 hypothetical protein Tbon_01675 [Tepidiforma bonchosmolovskayae]GIW15934.1 MAG: hypothetical protein KatS3mg063_1787 [Tepidiforma sp.]
MESPNRPNAAILALLPWLTAAALFELLVLRTGTRIAIHVPAGARLETPYLLLSAAGRYAFFVAIVLGVLALVASSIVAFRGTAPQRVAGVCGLLFLGAAAAARVDPGLLPVVDVAAALAVTAAAAAILVRRGVAAAVPFALLATATAAAAGYALVQTEPALPLRLSGPLLDGLELTGLAFALTLPLSVRRRPGPRALAAGIAAGAAAGGLLAAPASSGRIILLWNGGLSSGFPIPFYALAAAGLVIAAVQARSTRDQALFSAILLVAAGGLGLHNTYQTLLVLVGALAPALVAAPGAAQQPVAEVDTRALTPAAQLAARAPTP